MVPILPQIYQKKRVLGIYRIYTSPNLQKKMSFGGLSHLYFPKSIKKNEFWGSIGYFFVLLHLNFRQKTWKRIS